MKKGLHKPIFAQLLDQLLHALAAAVFVLVAVFIPSPWNGLALGLCGWAVREFTEGGNMFSSGSLVDMSGWAVGGLGLMWYIHYLGIV